MERGCAEAPAATPSDHQVDRLEENVERGRADGAFSARSDGRWPGASALAAAGTEWIASHHVGAPHADRVAQGGAQSLRGAAGEAVVHGVVAATGDPGAGGGEWRPQ